MFEKMKQRAAERKKRASSQAEQSKQLVLQLGNYGGLTPVYSVYADDLEQNEAFISCVQTNALYCSKAEFSSVRVLPDGEQKHDYKQLDKLLQYSPNPVMTAAVFWERVATYYYMYSNAFIYKEQDPLGNVIAFWSIDPSRVEFSKVSSGEILLKFQLNSKEIVLPYSEIIHIARNVVHNPMFGDKNDAIKRVVDLINLNYKGVENAIVMSAFIRFIGEVVTKVSPKELRKKAKEFTENYLNVSTKDPVGIVFTDSAYKLTPIPNGSQKTANYAETNQWNQSVYKFLGCPEKVIAGTATEDEMTAYYERTPESFFERVAQEMTRKVFTDREFDMGNRIVFSSHKLAYQTMGTKLKMFEAAREIGAFTLGTLGDLLGLPVPSGQRNIVVTSQNYSDQKPAKEKAGSKEKEEDPENVTE